MNNVDHKYAYTVDTLSDTAPANVIKLVGNNKRVLEFGCGPGAITRVLLQQNSCSVTGVELDLEAIKIVMPYCEAVFQADLNSKDWPKVVTCGTLFDVVVAADVLEHLYDPWRELRRMAQFINTDGYLVFSLPHVGHAAVAACLINGDFDYRDWGLLDRTHIRFFCLKNIEDMFTQAGLKIIEAKYVQMLPEATEFAASWAKLPDSVKIVLSSYAHAYIYQVVVKAVPVEYPGDPITLSGGVLNDLKPTAGDIKKTIKTHLRKWLPRPFIAGIKKSLNLLGLQI